MNAAPPAERPRWGFTSEELATLPTVYRSDLLKDKVYIVTGGSSGFGRAMAFLLARLGAKVIICARRMEKLQIVADDIKRTTGLDVTCYPMSIRDPEQVEKLMDDTFERFGQLDTVVNNAGGQFPQNAIDFSRKGWNAVIDLNLNGTWWMMQEAAKRWHARDYAGNIVNIVANIPRGMPQVAHTCAARAAVVYLSKTVAVEWAPKGIRVNCLGPGSMSTEGLNVYPENAVTRFADSNPFRKLGDAWDVAEGVVYLSAPSGKFITGELLLIDAGGQMWGNVWPAGVPDFFNVV
jgi:NAD(P)-dependent dehydrogenase (short-subunit alcohol dehydrogenase family)